MVEKETNFWKAPGGPVIDSMLPMQGAWVQSLVGELRSHIPHATQHCQKKEKMVVLIIDVRIVYHLALRCLALKKKNFHLKNFDLQIQNSC